MIIYLTDGIEDALAYEQALAERTKKELDESEIGVELEPLSSLLSSILFLPAFSSPHPRLDSMFTSLLRRHSLGSSRTLLPPRT